MSIQFLSQGLFVAQIKCISDGFIVSYCRLFWRLATRIIIERLKFVFGTNADLNMRRTKLID